MGRRGLGFLIVFAVIAAIAVVGVSMRRVAGRPVAAPIPGPPAVGECLLDSSASGWLYNPNPVYTSRRLEPCAGPRYGEVVAVIPDSRSPRQIAAASSDVTEPYGTVTQSEPIMLACSAAVRSYLGLPSGRLGDGRDAVNGWSYASSVLPAAAGPDDVQKAAGQHWVACLETNKDPDQQTGTALVTAQTYRGSARRVYSTGHPPSAFALCFLEMVLPSVLQPVNCSRPHAGEVFGVTQTESKHVTQTQLNVSCAKLARRLTGMPDPTVRGQLTVTVGALHVDKNGQEQLGFSTSAGEGGWAMCLLLAPEVHALNGALLGLGTGPVPWS